MFKLTIEDDEGKTTVVPLARDEMSIGRLDGNTIRLTERNVSRRHARLVRHNGALYVEDLASFTGVRVNGTRIAAATAVKEGDEVQIGDYRLVLRGERAASAATDRATMPSMPSVGPMATVGGSVAIPTRASLAAMAAQPGAPSTTAVLPGAQPPPRAAIHIPLAEEPTPTPEMVEGQPTIPLRALGDQDPDDTVTGPPARLFILTTDLAGMEIPLSRAALVIGRTDENDVVLNHRSISRHHAKIVRDRASYTIVDLQSANGVRVNGEDYERIELHPGDVVELGHVKLRFIGPLEEFVFHPEDVEPARRPPMKLVVGGAGAALALLVAAFAVLHGHHGAGPATRAAVPAPTPPPPPVAVRAAASPPPPVVVVPAVALAEAQQAAGAEDWARARAALARISPDVDDPALQQEAGALDRRAELEQQNAALYAQFDGAVTAKNYDVALAAYDRIASNSMYKQRARPRYETARSMIVAEHLAAAEQARAAGRCADVRNETHAVVLLDPRNLLARDLVRLCRPRAEPLAAAAPAARAGAPRVAGTPAPRAPRPRITLAAAESPSRAEARRGDGPREAAPRAEASEAEQAAEASALMKQAREAWMRQQCGSAVDLSRKALHVRPGLTDAYQIIAVCSCTLKDADAAGRAYAKLDDRNRGLVRSLCQKNGITIGE